MSTTLDNTTLNAINGSSYTAAANTKKDEIGSADRFLKLLVAQMQNQDPLNPMDNAQVTSQMAQINTVNGIEKLNSTVQGLSGNFMQMQALQGAALVGHDVIIEGNAMDMSTEGVGQGGFDLAGAADSVKVEVLNSAGRVVDTIDLKAQTAGRHSFNWDAGKADASDSYSFRVTALSGSAAVTTTSLMRDMVSAVSTGGDSLQLELVRSGTTPYAKVKAFN